MHRSLVIFSLLVASSYAQVAPGPSAPSANPQSTQEVFQMCDCGGPETADPQCGTDGQTYGNPCLLKCANVPLRYAGACEMKGCWPWEDSVCEGDFDDPEFICSNGLTFVNLASANCDGTGFGECGIKGVCPYHPGVSYTPTTGGKGINITDVVKNTVMPGNTDAPYDYSEALTKALLFYDSMISGNITEAGHKRLAWRDNSCFSCKGKYGEDLSGGFYEAGGSYMKFPGVINGWAGAFLALGGLEFADGYTKTDTMKDLKWKVKWAADHILNAHVEEFVFAGYLGNSTEDFDFYGPPELYDEYNNPRPVAYVTADTPASEIVGDASACLSAAYMLLKDDDPTWANNALVHARQLYNFGKTYQGSYEDSKEFQGHSNAYTSDGFNDELSFAAIMLHKATGEAAYLTEAKEFEDKVNEKAEETPTLEAATLWPANDVLIAQYDEAHIAVANVFFDDYLSLDVPHTPAGLAYPYSWGGNRHGANVAFLAMIHAKNPKVDPAYKARLVNYAMHQVNYLLGDAGRSWLVGFGKDYPTQLWHKMSYNSYLDWTDDHGKYIWMTNDDGPWAPEKKADEMYVMQSKLDMEGNWFPQRHIAYGMLFGAALFNDGLVAARKDYSYTEPTIEYNAGITGALAAMSQWYGQGPYAGVDSLEEVLPFNGVALAPAPAPLPVLPPVVAPAPIVAPQNPPPVPIVAPGGGDNGGVTTNTTTASNAHMAASAVAVITSAALFFGLPL